MDSARWERVQKLFHVAAALAPEERGGYLEGACGDDPSLVGDVLALLTEDSRGASLLDRPVAHVAHEVLGATPPLAPDTTFGPYRIIKALGEGGMGVVFLAERTDVRSLVALKVLRDAWLSPARRDRFAAEQRTLAQLNHPGIARLYDAGVLPDGTPWFVMEYVKGSTLTAHCRAAASSITERLRLFRDVCEAVQHAHGQAVIHRDLKPSNILVREDGAVRLLDFGIAKQLEANHAPADQTQTGLRLMTPAYAAPEQIRGERVGVHTDVYSLGVVLYELLADCLPFDLSNKTPGEAEATIVQQDAPKPSVAAGRTDARARASSRVWEDLDVLVLTAMHKEPGRRYRTVDALVRDVDHFLRGEPLEARPDSLGYRTGKFVRRNARAVAAAAAITVLFASLAVFYTLRLRSARNDAVAQATRAERIQRFTLNLFEGGDQEVGPAESLRVVTLLDRGVQEARTLASEPVTQAEMYETLGSVYQKLGTFARADSLLQEALALRTKQFGPASPEVAATLVSIGLLREAQAHFPEAEKTIREGLAIARRTRVPAHPDIARALAALGKVQENAGAYDSAIANLSAAVRMHTANGVRGADLRASMTELANSHFYAGHYPTSDSINRIVLDLDRRELGDRHPNVADDLFNLGAIQFEGGHYAEAERLDREALEITRAFYGPNHQETASALSMLGRALVSQEKYDEAITLLKEAVSIQEKVYGPVHPRVASALNELGRAAVLQKRLDEAEADFTRVANIYKVVHHDKHYVIGIALSNLAGVFQERKDYARAEVLFRDVLRRYGEVLEPGHQLVGIARIRLGRLLLRSGRPAEAVVESQAGYDILRKQAQPPASWLNNGRTDLIAEYESLKQSDKATRYRDELKADSVAQTKAKAP